MILLAALALAAAPGPVLYSAEARSVAYRDCIAAGHGRQPSATVVEIGRTACARARTRLVTGVREHISYGWAATAKTDGQARRLREHMKLEAEMQVVAFEARLQAWLTGTGGSAG
jgi:Flp pilus assembly protein TadB